MGPPAVGLLPAGKLLGKRRERFEEAQSKARLSSLLLRRPALGSIPPTSASGRRLPSPAAGSSWPFQRSRSRVLNGQPPPLPGHRVIFIHPRGDLPGGR
uniref:Uncharacterized protein n=1 Tax=Oryza rufipogon TaxID=4529 RepID=A0A0E0NBP1_ORYRU